MAVKLFRYTTEFTDDFELMKKVLTVDSVIRGVNGEVNRLKPQMINVLACYCLYGYNEESKQIVMEILGINRKNLNQLNSLLTSSGYLIRDTHNYRLRHLSPRIQKLVDFFAGGKGNKFLILEFNERNKPDIAKRNIQESSE